MTEGGTKAQTPCPPRSSTLAPFHPPAPPDDAWTPRRGTRAWTSSDAESLVVLASRMAIPVEEAIGQVFRLICERNTAKAGATSALRVAAR